MCGALFSNLPEPQRLRQQTPAPDGLYDLKVVWANTGTHQGPDLAEVIVFRVVA